MSLKPVIKWSGGKSSEIKYIEKYKPDNFKMYLEPFVGGGAYFFHLNHCKNVISDVHKDLINLYRNIKDGKSKEIFQFMKNNKNDEETYYKIRNMTCENDIDRACKFYYLRKTCFRGMLRYNKNGVFNVPFGRYKTCNFDILLNDSYEKLLKNTEIVECDFSLIFEKYNSEENFMFLDPPYDSEFTDYGFCKFGKEEHKRLCENFKSTNIKCLMIIGKTDFISELYNGYIVEEFDKKYSFKIHSGRVGNEINNKHLVIKNF